MYTSVIKHSWLPCKLTFSMKNYISKHLKNICSFHYSVSPLARTKVIIVINNVFLCLYRLNFNRLLCCECQQSRVHFINVISFLFL